MSKLIFVLLSGSCLEQEFGMMKQRKEQDYNLCYVVTDC